METPPDDIIEALKRMHLLSGAAVGGERLTGGVSSDIWRIDLETGPICVKRALAKLRVAADWRAPVARNRYEADWMRVAGAVVPEAVPALLGQDADSGALAMAYLPAARYRLWKARLRDGAVDPAFAAAVGATLGRIHAATAAAPGLAARFPTDEIFFDIRLDPYLAQAGRVHVDLAGRLQGLIATTQSHRVALVHGDVSPKNILCGPDGPVLLDAECAWWGDPAFDLAFCLNHLMLKCLWVPSATEALLASFGALVAGYLPLVDWEPRADVEARTARLLPGLFLARVDGKSPVEYVTLESQRAKVRVVARRLLIAPVARLGAVMAAWREELGA